ncbi:hypothetical protein F0L74_20385 [Chitinophaga agrisoli]|uniref:RHS repeat-associated protein n=1 Tax=Chitinophaga agrisoli TaxID=2607653 RepID=A0A5B2VI28_9BACT|nr:SpvB/TcaC N-terminal domain-containing protein [Chitinophaga agrisoli]KAA2238584.1 hypothetical protein F0L74_20385 [Chitinophaga agrisoli]
MTSKVDSSRIAAPKVTMPAGGGALRGISEPFKAQAFTGSGAFSIPFPLPDARGFSPTINLTYSSGAGNGLFGLGFSLSFDSVVRKTSTGIPHYDHTDVFILGSAGDLLEKYDHTENGWVRSAYTYTDSDTTWNITAWRPRLEAAFAIIEHWVDAATLLSHWKVVTADNKTSLYGISSNGRIYDPQRPQQIFEWLIECSYDAYGNKILYNYKPGDTTGIPGTSYNTGRDFSSQRYPDTIRYGNYTTQEDDTTQEHFAFELIFDYGQLNKDDPDAPPSAWTARPDPFSTYKSGFEIRTARLCQGIYLRHHFTLENEGQPFTTTALLPEYDLSGLSGFAMIKQVINRGYKTRPGQPLWIADTPPTVLSYQDFTPLAAAWQLLEADAPGYLDANGFIPVDLEGIGMDGLLYSTPAFTAYLAPLGNGKYAPMRVLQDFPVFRDLQTAPVSLTSLEGNSVLDLVVNNGGINGYFENGGLNDWLPFRPFNSFPVEYLSPEKETTDLSGAGRHDLLFADNRQLKFYPSYGKAGFGAAAVAYTPARFPPTGPAGQEQLTGFADFLGDGLSHRFRLCNGSLTVWPCLGHGHFGDAITLANAPLIDGLFDAARLFLIDADGSGATDIVYCYPGYARIWFNQNGNAFSDPVDLPFPASYSNITSITAGDVSGYGTASLIFTTADPELKHFYYDFSNKKKPYLLQSVDNGTGGLSALTYTTSVLELLRDKQAGYHWATRLPMPVSVVSETTATDQLTGAIYTQRFRYHDGYFDPVEREFRGFGFVETWDTDTFASFQAAAATDAKRARLLEEQLWAPPVYTRTWFITGAYEQTPEICAQYQTQFYKGDTQQWTIPAFELDAPLHQQDAAAIRQAYAAMAGTPVRTEVYADDDTALAHEPYTVSMSTLLVSLVQPRINSRYCSLMTTTVNALNYTYDRNPADPLIGQHLTLATDQYGNPLLSTDISFPRRNVPGAIIYPEQQQWRILISDAAYINTISTTGYPADTWQHIGLNWQTRTYETGGITTPDNAPFTRADLLQQVLAALQNPVVPTAAPPLQPWSRLLSWDRSVYWNNDGTTTLAYGETNALSLLHHQETAALSPDQVTRSFGDKVGNTILANDCGYVFEDGYWWNYGLMQSYNWSSRQFYQPSVTRPAIATIYTQEVLDDSGFNGNTTVSYDPYYLSVIQTAEFITAEITVSTYFQYDYHVMQPWRNIDANQTVSELLYDPLGQVIVSTVYGEINGQKAGDLPLDQYVLQPNATFNDIIANPAKYLQGATIFYYYDLAAWLLRNQPVNAISLTRNLHVQALGLTGNEPLIPISIAYSNGLGGLMQSKDKTTPGTAPGDRWLVSGYTVYNNKGMPVEQYEPYFSDTPDFEDQQEIIDQELIPPPTVTFYDPMDRVIRLNSPKGFFSKTVYGSWETNAWDFNDTMPDSTYYQWFLANYPQDPAPWQVAELNALNAALPCYNTPETSVLDNQGNTIRTITRNLGAITSTAIPESVAAPMTQQDTWNALLNAGYLAKKQTEDTAAWVTPAFQPYQPGFHQHFLTQFPDNGARLEDYLTQTCLTAMAVYDLQGQQLSNTDPRLFLAMVRENTPYFNFRSEYAMDGQVLQSDSADAGLRWSLQNIAGNAAVSWDSRGFVSQNKYDNLQRPLGMYVSGGDQSTPLANWVQRMVYGETAPNAAGLNLVGKPWKEYDDAGLTVINSYGLAGKPLQVNTYLRPDYKTTANWTAQAQQDIINEPVFTRSTACNVTGQVIWETQPDGSQLAYEYNINSALQASKQKIANPAVTADPQWQTVISNIEYNAAGQRLSAINGNGVITRHAYDPLTQLLRRTYATSNITGQPEVLQDVGYTYDPVGHTITATNNNAETVFNNNQQIDPVSTYTYDPLYRIISATGRTLPGLRQNTTGSTTDLQNLENYTQLFAYDLGNNLVLKRQVATSASWSQVMTIAAGSNRLNTMYAGNAASQPSFTYDANGNMLVLQPGSTAQISWNYANYMAAVVNISRNVTNPQTGENMALDDAEYYQYDINGNRVRKITEQMANGGTQILYTEKIYLGSYQRQRSWTAPVNTTTSTPITPDSEKHTLVVNDGDAAVLITHLWTIPPPIQTVIAAGDVCYRYQLCDPLNSVRIEVNEAAGLFTYEEYYVYGGTAYMLSRNQLDADTKELRFCGKERDNTTGLYYYGARYYADWLARWMSPDPAGPVDGFNLYEYAGGNPVNYNDPTGMNRTRVQPPRAVKTQLKNVARTAAKSGKGRKAPKAAKLTLGRAPKANRKKVVRKVVTNQSQLTGNAKKERTKPYPSEADPLTAAANKRYVTSTSSGVIALLKVNGLAIQAGENGRAAEHLDFYNIGTSNQRGTKDNPHAEDWATSSLQNNAGSYGKPFTTFLKDIGVPNSSNNTAQGGKNVFSLRINYSPCLGCVNTIKNFKDDMEQELGESIVLRVKFLRPYDLPVTLQDASKDKFQNFKSSVEELEAAGIPVRIQTKQSAQKMAPTEDLTSQGDFGTGTISRLDPVLYKRLMQDWKTKGVNRT